MSKQHSEKQSSKRPLWVRLLAIALTVLLCSGALVYLVSLLMSIWL